MEFKEFSNFIRKNFTRKIKYHDITNNTKEIINECDFLIEDNYIVIYKVNETCEIIFSIVILNKFFIYSYGVSEEKRAYISFLDILNSIDGFLEFI